MPGIENKAPANRQTKKVATPPPHGWVRKMVKLTGFSQPTITAAVRHNTRGVKAEKVRQLYRELYGEYGM